MQYSTRRGTWDSKDCALILIDYQPEMFRQVRSMDSRTVETHVGALAKAASAFGIPIVLSTVGVQMGVNQPTIASLKNILSGVDEIDRSSMNAWEDANFQNAVRSTGRSRLVMCGLWTEICLAFPAIDALKEGYDVSFVADAVGGQSKEEHDLAVSRLVQAGAVPNTTIAMIAEWFHDWKSPLATRGREILVSIWRDRAVGRRETLQAQFGLPQENRIEH